MIHIKGRLRIAFLSLHFVLVMLALCWNTPCATPSPIDLQKRFEAIAKTAHGRVGAAVELLESKESIMLNGLERFPMQSVYKLPIAMAVLQRVDDGTLKLEQLIQVTTNDLIATGQYIPIAGTSLSVSNLLRKMVSESDNTACDVLSRLMDGPASVDRFLRSLGLTNVVVATTEKEMSRDQLVQYRNWATPEGAARLLRMLQEGRGLSASSREMLLRFMTETSTGRRRIKGLLPAETPVAHKTGTSGTEDGLTRATNDIGILTLPDGRHVAIAVFVSDSRADEATREAVISKIARAAWDYWIERAQ